MALTPLGKWDSCFEEQPFPRRHPIALGERCRTAKHRLRSLRPTRQWADDAISWQTTCPEMTRNLPSRTNRPSFLPAQVERNSEVYELPIVRPLACVLRGTRGTEEKHFKNQNSCRVLRAFPDYLGGSFAAHRSEQPRNFRAMLRTHPDCEERKVASRRVADEDMCALEEVQLSESTVKRWPRPRR
jgi:hypothetical protein